jgi:hypothetical protein
MQSPAMPPSPALSIRLPLPGPNYYSEFGWQHSHVSLLKFYIYVCTYKNGIVLHAVLLMHILLYKQYVFCYNFIF